MKHPFLAFRTLIPALALAAGASAVPDGVPCIAEGGTGEVEHDRPDLEADGMPTDAEWIDPEGRPEGFDVDTWSGNDSLGNATSSPGGGSAGITLRNSGGTLYGPNGAGVEGGLEGDCLEVILVWRYRYKVNVTVGHTSTFSIAPEGIGGSTGGTSLEQHSVWRHGTAKVGPTEVCPC